MSPLSSFLLLVYVYFLTILIRSNTAIKVSTTLGDVESTEARDGKINGFLGIPYAISPVKEKRLAQAEVKEWKSMHTADRWSRACIDRVVDGNRDEDCLHLDLLIPKNVEHKPNLLVIFSNEQFNESSVLNLVKREVAVGIVRFRTGFLGFGTLIGQDKRSPGITDISAAIKFILDNLDNFSISKKVTFVAEHDDAAALHLALQNENSDENTKLSLILLNGHSLINRFTPNNDRTIKSTHAVAKSVICDLPSPIQATDCLRTIPINRLVEAVNELPSHEPYGAPFRPMAADLTLSVDLPMIVGISTEVPSIYYKTVNQFLTNYTYAEFKLLLSRLVSDNVYKNGPLIRRMIWHEYVKSKGDKNDTYLLWQQGRQLLHDWHYAAPTAELIKNRIKNKSTTFAFKYEIDNLLGTCLGSTPEYLIETCNLWWKFALRFLTKGRPTQESCDPSKPNWPQLGTKKREYYVLLKTDATIEWNFPYAREADVFWNDLVPFLETVELAGKRQPAFEDDLEIKHALEEEDDLQQYHVEKFDL